MGSLRTKFDDLPAPLLKAAQSFVERLSLQQRQTIYRLASNARQQIVSKSGWQEFDVLLREFRITPTNRDHATAVLLAVLPDVIRDEKFARFAALREAQARASAKRVPTHRIEVSTESSASIERGAERFALTLERLAKK